MGVLGGYVLVEGFLWLLWEALSIGLIFAPIRSSPSLKIRRVSPWGRYDVN